MVVDSAPAVPEQEATLTRRKRRSIALSSDLGDVGEARSDPSRPSGSETDRKELRSGDSTRTTIPSPLSGSVGEGDDEEELAIELRRRRKEGRRFRSDDGRESRDRLSRAFVPGVIPGSDLIGRPDVQENRVDPEGVTTRIPARQERARTDRSSFFRKGYATFDAASATAALPNVPAAEGAFSVEGVSEESNESVRGVEASIPENRGAPLTVEPQPAAEAQTDSPGFAESVAGKAAAMTSAKVWDQLQFSLEAMSLTIVGMIFAGPLSVLAYLVRLVGGHVYGGVKLRGVPMIPKYSMATFLAHTPINLFIIVIFAAVGLLLAIVYHIATSKCAATEFVSKEILGGILNPLVSLLKSAGVCTS